MSSSVEMRAGVCVTSPRLCWETGASVCPVFAPTTPPTPSAVVFLTHTHPAEGVDTALYVCWTQRPPPPLCGEAALAVMCGWVWSESGVSAEGGGERPCSFPLRTRELACSDYSGCLASPVLPRMLLFSGRSVELRVWRWGPRVVRGH